LVVTSACALPPRTHTFSENTQHPLNATVGCGLVGPSLPNSVVRRNPRAVGGCREYLFSVSASPPTFRGPLLASKDSSKSPHRNSHHLSRHFRFFEYTASSLRRRLPIQSPSQWHLVKKVACWRGPALVNFPCGLFVDLSQAPTAFRRPIWNDASNLWRSRRSVRASSTPSTTSAELCPLYLCSVKQALRPHSTSLSVDE
jgi:hypothetical protein